MDRISAARSLHALLHKTMASGAPKYGGGYGGPSYVSCWTALREEPDYWKLVPDWIRDNEDLEDVAELLRKKFPAIKARQDYVSIEFAPLLDFIRYLESAANHPAFIVSTETYIARVFEVLKTRGAIRAIGALYTAKLFEWEDHGMDFGRTFWHLKIHLPFEKVYSRYSDDDWRSVADEIESAMQAVGRSDDSESITEVRLVPIVAVNPDWRSVAFGVLT